MNNFSTAEYESATFSTRKISNTMLKGHAGFIATITAAITTYITQENLQLIATCSAILVSGFACWNYYQSAMKTRAERRMIEGKARPKNKKPT